MVAEQVQLAACGFKIIFAQPQKELIAQTEADLRAEAARRGVSIDIRAIHGDSDTKVVEAIVRHIKQAIPNRARSCSSRRKRSSGCRPCIGITG